MIRFVNQRAVIDSSSFKNKTKLLEALLKLHTFFFFFLHLSCIRKIELSMCLIAACQVIARMSLNGE